MQQGKLSIDKYLQVPFGAIENEQTFLTVTDYYKNYKQEGYVTTDNRRVLQAVGWVFTNAQKQIKEHKKKVMKLLELQAQPELVIDKMHLLKLENIESI